MLKRIFRRNLRQPIVTLAVLLFAAALTVVLCYLHRAGEQEMQSFEETYASVPVFFKVTDLDGSKVPLTDLTGEMVAINSGIKGWVVDLFTDRGLQPNLSPYVKEMHVRVSIDVKWTEPDPKRPNHPIGIKYNDVAVGITSTYVAEELTEGWGGKIYWNEGYDESVLNTQELVCLVPESMKDKTELDLTFYCYIDSDRGGLITLSHNEVLQVVGYYTDPGNTRIYCPYPVMQKAFAHMGVPKRIEELGAILNDNSKIDLLKKDAALWFAEPNPMGEKTEWGRFDYDYYFYALDIDDTMLHNLEMNMKNSMRLNALASLVVFALSAGAGFLTGFLVIRSRKRDIALMRTMGASQVSIYAELALEQLVCITLGIILGGGNYFWQPVQRLVLFGGIYFVGLTAALIVFLRKNLLTTIKEDE